MVMCHSPPARRWPVRVRRVAVVVVLVLISQILCAAHVHSSADQVAATSGPAAVRFLPGSPIYALKRVWEQVRLAFIWDPAGKATYLAELIRTRAAEMVAVSARGDGSLTAALARDQEKLIKQAEKALGALKQTAKDLDVIDLVEQAAAAALRNFSEATRGAPDSARESIEEAGRSLSNGVQQLVGELGRIRDKALESITKGAGKEGRGVPGKPTR